jgi:hypothetical protein
MLAALLVFSQVVAPSLDALTTQAAPIALVRVEKLHAIDQVNARMDFRAWPEDEVRIAECAVERMLLGDPKAERLFVTLRVPRSESYELAIGERIVVFGDWQHFEFHPSAPTAKRLDRLAGVDGLVVPLTAGVWRVRTKEGRELVEWPLSINAFPKSLDEKRVAAELPLAVFLDWLDHEIEQTTPTFECTESPTGPSNWWIRLARDGTHNGTDEGTLETAALERLWSTLEQEHFTTLPAHAGRSCGPDARTLIMRTRTRQGIHEVRLVPECADRITDPAEIEFLQRTLRVWESIPGAKKPKIAGAR